MLNEKANDVRTNIIYQLHNIYQDCLLLLNEKYEWVHEGYTLSWNGVNNLKMTGSDYLIEVIEGEIKLDDKIQSYYQLPYSWIQSIRKEFNREFTN